MLKSVEFTKRISRREAVKTRAKEKSKCINCSTNITRGFGINAKELDQD